MFFGRAAYCRSKSGIALLLAWGLGNTVLIAAGSQTGISFPGKAPGKARAVQAGPVFTLENDVISATWESHDGHLSPKVLSNKLAGTYSDQTGRELFRLGTREQEKLPIGYIVAVGLSPDSVRAMVSRDGNAWVTLATFPRSSFAGEPKLVRIGKMNLQAETKDYAGEPGNVGRSVLSEISPPLADGTAGLELEKPANVGATVEHPFPAGTQTVSCRIDKNTDAGMSWAPGLALIWNEGKQFVLVGVRDKAGVFNVSTAAGEQIISALPEPYLTFDLNASAFRFSSLRMTDMSPQRGSTTIAGHFAGKVIEANATSVDGLRAHWRAELRDGSNYIRQTLELQTDLKAAPLYAVELADVALGGARTIGTCPGCPVASNGWFAGVEMPGAVNAIDANGARIGFRCKLQVTPEQPYEFSQLVGVAPPGQLRRAFLYYIERERARPSKPFLHYNSWYDLGADNVNQDSIINAVNAYTKELTQQRGVALASFLIDDGWDDVGKGLWAENSADFPGGFAGLAKQLRPVDAHLGLWISPLGGYNGQQQRTATAVQMGLIPQGSELNLSQPLYKQWFFNRCKQLMKEAGVNIFKWDKAGDGVSPHFMALLDIARNLRKVNPNLFINVTVGTWPSPFWLNFIDTTWRSGSGDVAWEGKGLDPNDPHDRERWLTFRDGYCYRLFAQKSPLYPLNSAMFHGLVLGRYFQGAQMAKVGLSFKHEVRSYFANGASLQELYLTPSLMTAESWDQVAESAKWAQANADVLADSHWFGGDPLKLEPYGYAAWNERKGTLMLRNPDNQSATISVDPAVAFELPPGAATHFTVKCAYGDDSTPVTEMYAGRRSPIALEPFGVLVLEMTPQK